MSTRKLETAIVIRELNSYDDLKQVPRLEKEVWQLADEDVLPMTFIIASQAAGSLWQGAFDGPTLVGFAFGILGREHGKLAVHSHMLAVRLVQRDQNIGYRLKLAQRERALAMGIPHISWTFDPLQSKNAYFNFARLGVVSSNYRPDFYGPETSSVLHRNGTDRLWVEWRIASRRVQQLIAGKDHRGEAFDLLPHLTPLLRFDGAGHPSRTDLAAAVGRQRLAIEIPGDINHVEQRDMPLAREWRHATRWAFTQALAAGFFVAEFFRSVRGQQGPGAYLLEKKSQEEDDGEL
jgi:predicted GNAT superfamily acetyltransferase